jgi:hypothetical protein
VVLFVALAIFSSRRSIVRIEKDGAAFLASNGTEEEPAMARKSFFACISRATLLAACAWLPLAATHAQAANNKPFLPKFFVTSTISDSNGDLNPYGVAFVPAGFPSGGKIAPGDVLVSNFNDSMNCQGRGTTIIQFNPNNASGAVAPSVPVGMNGNATTFFTSPQFGLSTALGVLKGGFVIVGNVASPDDSECGCQNMALPGVLQVIDRNGNLVTTLTDTSPSGNYFGSPWDLTIANDKGSTAQVFVSNVLTGTVGRLDLAVGPTTVTIQHQFVVAQGYANRSDMAAFELGPTGLVVDGAGNLFVASTLDNEIFKVSNATKPVPPPPTTGAVVFSDPHLRGPLGLAFTPGGNLLTANGDAVNPDPTHPSEIVEFTPAGAFIREFNIDAGQDAAFGIATALTVGVPFVFNFAAVNDNNNSLLVHSLPVP